MSLLSGLRIGSRRSDLARLQAQMVGARLGTQQYVFKEAPGDINLKDPLWKMPEMGVFTSFLRRYLISGEIDLVVHSWKDLPVEPDPASVIVGTTERADTRDLLLVSKAGLARAYDTGTLVVLSSSPRRKFNLPDFLVKSIPVSPSGQRIQNVEFRDVRGNIQTRLTKLVESDDGADALIVAKAAIDRFLVAGREFHEFEKTGNLVRNAISQCLWQVLPLSVNPTAAAQGALAVEMLSQPNLEGVREQVRQRINCKSTFDAVNEERSILHSFGGGCHQKIGCTILQRQWGKVTFLRGQTDKVPVPMCVNKIDPYSDRQAPMYAASEDQLVQIGGKSGVQLYDRVAVAGGDEKLASVLTRCDPNVGVYVAKADAVPSSVTPATVKDRVMWTAGVQSWYSLAARGFWVNGSSDSLGEEEPIGVEHITDQPANRWVKLTHTGGNNAESEKFESVVSTYALELKADAKRIVDEAVAGKTHFFFSSGSAFRAMESVRPDLAAKFNQRTFVAGCGPGSTLDFLESRLGKGAVVVSYNYADFVRQVRPPTK